MQAIIVKNAINKVAYRINLNERLIASRGSKNEKTLQTELDKKLPVKIQNIIEDKITRMLDGNDGAIVEEGQIPGAAGAGNDGSVNPVLASMLIAQMKSEYGLFQGQDVASSGAFFEVAGDFFNPIQQYKEYFFKQQRSLWDRFMEDEDNEAFHNFLRQDNPNHQMMTKIKEMFTNQEKRFTCTCLLSDVVLQRDKAFLGALVDKINECQLTTPLVKDDFNKVWKLMDYLR